MSPTFATTLEGRHLSLRVGNTVRLSLPLDQGGRHRLVVDDAAMAQRVVAALERCPGVGVLPAGGGLLGAMTVAENFTLALRYASETPDLRDDERELETSLQLCGLAAERIATLGRDQPMKLERNERWTLGFARYLLRPPELLVIDRLFGGLTRREANALLAVEAIYHQRHPFRPVLFVDLDSHELPELPECQTLTELSELAEKACHS